MYLGGIGVFGSPLMPMSGLSRCFGMVTKYLFITSHLCRWNLRSFRPAPQEVSKMLLKGVLEPGDQQLAVSCGGPVIDLSALSGYLTLMKFRMETVVSVLESIRKGSWMFSIDLKDAYFQIPVHLESWLHLRFCLEGCFYHFCALCFGLSTAPQVFTRVFALLSEWAHRRGVRLLRYLDDWLVIMEARTLLRHWDLILQLCRDLSVVVNWEKSNLQPSTRVQYLEMLIDTSLEKVFLSGPCLARFREVATSFLLLPSPRVVRPLGFAGVFTPLRSLMHASIAVVPEGLLVSHGRQSCHSDPSVTGVHGGSSLVAPEGQVGIRCPSPGSSSVRVATYRCVSVGLGNPSVRSLGVWSQESSLHINVLEMKAVVLVLAAFLPQLSSQSVILMSDNATVVAYLRNQAAQCLVSCVT